MKIFSFLTWVGIFTGWILFLAGSGNVPYWLPIGLAVLTFLLFSAQISIKKASGTSFLLSSLMSLNWAFGKWVYHTWETVTWMNPLLVTRIVSVITLILILYAVFIYHRIYLSMSRKTQKKEKQRTSHLSFLKRLFKRRDNEITFVLGNQKEE
ncbi:hypothetical protein L1765_11170 [Microaerobacter geothermalis]|uniref:hypothetical protein n=1 Tax=Microaerobacter geothermalis TaxID=674972 RepID=UPI001F1BB6A7|nr:hypothetical protein [Microaerobacter geothermalis]MCF6094523.1 hypothetical protein [Microaerobacter geothermalis]